MTLTEILLLQSGQKPFIYVSTIFIKGRRQKKNVIFSDIVTIAFDPHPP